LVTGSAGTGKTRLLNAVQYSDHNTIVVAPTGIAAIQASGQTIHSFFGLRPGSFVSKMRPQAVKALKNANRLVIDEISMVRVDLMQAVNDIMQDVLQCGEPFGGIPVIAFGDQAQIEPVVKNDEIELIHQEFQSHFFFDAPCVKDNNIEVIKLNTIYRQKGEVEFIEALQSLRHGKADKLSIFNKRIDVPEDDCLRITYTNDRCALINESKLKQIDTKLYVSKGDASGDFTPSEYPVDEKVFFKIGAKCMLLINNREIGNEYVNGDIGTVVDVQPGKVFVLLDRTKNIVYVEKFTWEKFEYTGRGGSVESSPVGTYTQLPIKLAWSFTAHKVQGQTFHNKVHIELETKSFAHGLLYVALSRATKLDNLTIGRKIYANDIIIHQRVVDWCEQYGV
jgi:ATP-dependent exoDNAse (exonuclease V) alpha subunit